MLIARWLCKFKPAGYDRVGGCIQPVSAARLLVNAPRGCAYFSSTLTRCARLILWRHQLYDVINHGHEDHFRTHPLMIGSMQATWLWCFFINRLFIMSFVLRIARSVWPLCRDLQLEVCCLSAGESSYVTVSPIFPNNDELIDWLSTA